MDRNWGAKMGYVCHWLGGENSEAQQFSHSFKNQSGQRIGKRTGSQFSSLTEVRPMVKPMIS